MCIKIIYNNKTLFLPNISFCPPDVNLRTGTGRGQEPPACRDPPRNSPAQGTHLKRARQGGWISSVSLATKWSVPKTNGGLDKAAGCSFAPSKWRKCPWQAGWSRSHPGHKNCPLPAIPFYKNSSEKNPTNIKFLNGEVLRKQFWL